MAWDVLLLCFLAVWRLMRAYSELLCAPHNFITHSASYKYIYKERIFFCLDAAVVKRVGLKNYITCRRALAQNITCAYINFSLAYVFYISRNILCIHIFTRASAVWHSAEITFVCVLLQILSTHTFPSSSSSSSTESARISKGEKQFLCRSHYEHAL